MANSEDGTLSRIDPRRGVVTDTVPVGAGPAAVAVTHGSVHVAAGGRRRAPRAAEPRVTGRSPTGATPAGLAVAGEDVWATATSPPGRHSGGTLHVGVSGMPERVSLDPVQAGELRTFRLAGDVLTFDGLVGYRRAPGSAAGVLVPLLAEAVPRPSADRRTYVSPLQRGLRFADGTPVRAADVRASLGRWLTTDASA